jgi:hypothetical protein
MNRDIIYIIFFIFCLNTSYSQTIRDSLSGRYIKQELYSDCFLKTFKYKYLDTLTNPIILDNEFNINVQIEFLNKEFNTDLFSFFNIYRSCDFNVYLDKGLLLNFGIIEVGYKDSNIAEEIYNIILSTNKNKLSSKVWTKFKAIRNDKNVLIFVSRTPLEKSINDFFTDLNNINCFINK